MKRKLTFKRINFIEHLTALNFATFNNITWKLLEKRWRAKHSPKKLWRSIEKVSLIASANFLMLASSYCSGVFVGLAAHFEDEFWDNNTLIQMDGLENIEVNEGIGILQSSGQAFVAVFGVITGCVVTATKGTLKGRILIINVVAAIYGVVTILGMMLAETYWTYYVAYAAFMAGQGVVSAVALPTQLLIASQSNQLVVQGLTVISKYAGLIVGVAVTAWLYENRYDQAAFEGEYVGGLEGLTACINNLTDEVRAELGTIDLWACMDARMRSYFPAGILAIAAMLLFFVNPRTWKHICSTAYCGHRAKGRFENRFYNLRSRRFSAQPGLDDTHSGGGAGGGGGGGAGISSKKKKKTNHNNNLARVAPATLPSEQKQPETTVTAAEIEDVVDLETMSEEDVLRLLYNEIFVPQSQ